MSTSLVPGYGEGGYGEGGYGGLSNSAPFLSYYLGLITSQYQNSTIFLTWLTAVLQIVADLQACLATITDAFTLSEAAGAQLDIIGNLVGVSRVVTFQPSNSVSPKLDDNTYVLLIQAKIAQNQWDGQLQSLYTIWQGLFPGGQISVQDNQNMTAQIFLSGSFSSIVQDLINNGYIVPRPEAVLYNYIFANLPTFGFDENNEFIAGFDIGDFS